MSKTASRTLFRHALANAERGTLDDRVEVLEAIAALTDSPDESEHMQALAEELRAAARKTEQLLIQFDRRDQRRAS